MESERVEVEVVNADYTNYPNYPFITNGRYVGGIQYDDKYLLVVEYNDMHYYFDEAESYYKYKDIVGQTVEAILETCTYDDGTERRYIILQ